MDPMDTTDDRIPLFQRLRPDTLEGVVGQDHLLGPNGPLERFGAGQPLSSLILWGPPGCGKTTLAFLLAKQNKRSTFHALSAITSGVSDLRPLFEGATKDFQTDTQTILFVDEIHRFNRAQQDAFLPHMESGVITLIGATTENPSFALNGALLSRCAVFALKSLDEDALKALLKNAAIRLGSPLPLTPDGQDFLIKASGGDGRFLLRQVAALLTSKPPSGPADPDGVHRWTTDQLQSLIQKKPALYDKNQDMHYNLISVLHKAIRGSDVQAALYWFSRMIDGGEDPMYILRRLVRCASEDVGLADPDALARVLAARDAYQFLGAPEGILAISGAVVYLALAPKSNALYTAHQKAAGDAAKNGALSPPLFALNAPTPLMRQEGYGKGYHNDHHTTSGCAGQNYFPDTMGRQTYYTPAERGFERDMKKRLAYFNALSPKRHGDGGIQ